MRCFIAVCAVVCSTSVLVVAQCNPAEKTQIEAIRNAWKTNWNAKQLDNVISLYATDAALLPSDGTRATGKTEIKAALQKQLGSTVAITSVSVDCSGEFAYDSGTYTSDVPANSGMTLTGVGGGGSKHIEGQYRSRKSTTFAKRQCLNCRHYRLSRSDGQMIFLFQNLSGFDFRN